MLLPQLRYWRERRSLTMRELAERSGVALGTVFRLEHGKSAYPPTARKLAAALGVEPREIMASEHAEPGQHEAAA